MKKVLFAAGAAVLGLTATPSMAVDVNLHPYATSANYCPAGLQPIVLGGDISCGRPNTTADYFDVKRHPVQRRKVVHRTYMSDEMYGSKGYVGSKSYYGN